MKQGIHKGLPAIEYREWDALSYSTLKEGRRSMLHLRHALTTPREDTPALILGEALHIAVLEPERFAVRYACPPKIDRRTTAGKREWATWVEENPNAVPLTRDEWDRCGAMREAVESHPEASRLLRGVGFNEVSVVWEDRETGVLLKGRPDRVCKFDGWSCVVDVKTTRDASAPAFAGAVARYGYAMQAAMYLDALALHAPSERRFLHVAIESEAPHAIAVYELETIAVEQGRAEYHEVLRAYARCIETGEWPGYPTGIQPLDLPKWAQRPGELEAA